MKIKKIATAALAAVLTAAALTGCSEKEAISGEGSSNGSSSSVYSSSNITANSSDTTNSFTTSISSSTSFITSTDDSNTTSTSGISSDVETSSVSGETSNTTGTGNDEPSVIISTITDNSNPQEQWNEHIFDNPITFYINQNNVNSRSKPIQGSGAIKTYSLNEKVSVVAETDTDYFKLDDSSYVHFDYLNRNPVEIKDTNLKIGDKNSKGYTIIGFTSDGNPYIGIDEKYEKSGDVIIDYMINGKPVYKSDPAKKQEISDKIPGSDLDHITMGN